MATPLGVVKVRMTDSRSEAERVARSSGQVTSIGFNAYKQLVRQPLWRNVRKRAREIAAGEVVLGALEVDRQAYVTHGREDGLIRIGHAVTCGRAREIEMLLHAVVVPPNVAPFARAGALKQNVSRPVLICRLTGQPQSRAK